VLREEEREREVLIMEMIIVKDKYSDSMESSSCGAGPMSGVDEAQALELTP
jgi:hypothetical protein